MRSPKLEAMKGCAQPPQFHPEGDVFRHTRLMLELLPNEVSLSLVLSVLFHDIGKPPTSSVDEAGRIRFNGHDRVGAEMTEALMERLRFSRAEIEATVEAVRQHMVFKDVPNMRIAKLKRFMARPTFGDELELHRVDCASSHGMLDNYEFLTRKREEFANEPIIPPPLVRGDDLIALGMKPGPRFGENPRSGGNAATGGRAARPRRGAGLDKKEIPVRRGLTGISREAESGPESTVGSKEARRCRILI
jgi:putative nucleotidyltransferase with HDIG domain